MTVKTAEQHIKDIDNLRDKLRKERIQFEIEQSKLEYCEDLRDDVMSLVKNSGMSYADIHAKCGPCPKTLSSWANKEVHTPKLSKIQSVLRILGYDLGIVNGRRGVKKLN